MWIIVVEAKINEKDGKSNWKSELLKKVFCLGETYEQPVRRERQKEKRNKEVTLNEMMDEKRKKKWKRYKSNFAFFIDYSYERDMNNRFNADA